MMNKKTLGYDETKRMLNTLRKLNESKTSVNVIREQSEGSPVMDDLAVVNDVDVKILSADKADMKLSEEDKTSLSGMIDNFKQQVSNLVEFEPGFSITTEQIRLDGVLTDFDLDFVLIAGEEHGLYVNADMLKVDKDTIDIMTKLEKYFNTFVTPMNELINQRKNN